MNHKSVQHKQINDQQQNNQLISLDFNNSMHTDP